MDHPRFLGVAGPAGSDSEKACIKQALFLLRYRLRIRDLAPTETDPR
jgi:hypothetical protein